jgi:hypothetical protein
MVSNLKTIKAFGLNYPIARDGGGLKRAQVTGEAPKVFGDFAI